MINFKFWLLKEEISPKEAWEVLGLPYGSSLDKVKQAYLDLIRKSHPDKNPNDPNATKNSIMINQAKDVLFKFYDFVKKDADNTPIVNNAESERNYGSYKETSETAKLYKEVFRNLSILVNKPLTAFRSEDALKSLVVLNAIFIDFSNRLGDGPSTDYSQEYINSNEIDIDWLKNQSVADNFIKETLGEIKQFVVSRNNSAHSRWSGKSIGEEDISELNDSIGHRLLILLNKYSQALFNYNHPMLK